MNNLLVKCPACREVIEVDARTGRVLKHHPEVKPKTGGDFLKDRLKSMEDEKARREALVAGSKEREKKRSERHDEIFKKVKEQAKEGPAERTLRDIDLD